MGTRFRSKQVNEQDNNLACGDILNAMKSMFFESSMVSRDFLLVIISTHGAFETLNACVMAYPFDSLCKAIDELNPKPNTKPKVFLISSFKNSLETA